MPGADLMQGAVDLAMNKSMEDLRTLLEWIETDTGRERIRHCARAIELLQEMKENLESL